MTTNRLMLALSLVILVTSTVIGADRRFASPDGSQSCGCVGTAPGCVGHVCQYGFCQSQDDGFVSRFRNAFSRKCRKTRVWWYRHQQRAKHLQHPECPPFFQPNWGYNETCWRPFNPLCNTCPQPLTNGFVPPVPKKSNIEKSVPEKSDTDESVLPPLPPTAPRSENETESRNQVWQLTRESKD